MYVRDAFIAHFIEHTNCASVLHDRNGWKEVEGYLLLQPKTFECACIGLLDFVKDGAHCNKAAATAAAAVTTAAAAPTTPSTTHNRTQRANFSVVQVWVCAFACQRSLAYTAMRCLHVFKTENLKRFSLYMYPFVWKTFVHAVAVLIIIFLLCIFSSSSSSSSSRLLLSTSSRFFYPLILSIFVYMVFFLFLFISIRIQCVPLFHRLIVVCCSLAFAPSLPFQMYAAVILASSVFSCVTYYRESISMLCCVTSQSSSKNQSLRSNIGCCIVCTHKFRCRWAPVSVQHNEFSWVWSIVWCGRFSRIISIQNKVLSVNCVIFCLFFWLNHSISYKVHQIH